MPWRPPSSSGARPHPPLVVEVGASLQRFTVMKVQKGRNGTLPCSAVITCPLLARLQGENPLPLFQFSLSAGDPDAFSDLDHMTFETRSGLHSHIVCRNRSIADRASIL